MGKMMTQTFAVGMFRILHSDLCLEKVLQTTVTGAERFVIVMMMFFRRFVFAMDVVETDGFPVMMMRYDRIGKHKRGCQR